MQQAIKEFQMKHSFPTGIELKSGGLQADHALLMIARDLQKWSNCLEENIKRDCSDELLRRVHLMLEELAETIEGMRRCDELQVLDGLADLLYVAIGTAVTYGLPLEDAFWEVHRSNMTKQVCNLNDPRLRDKGPDYVPPNLRQFLERGKDGNPEQVESC